MVHADNLRNANPWHPITNAVDLKHLGKFCEELGECVSATSRVIIQGLHEQEPVTGKVNSLWLCEEIADVLANIELVCEHFQLSREMMQPRIDKKKLHLKQWHKLA